MSGNDEKPLEGAINCPFCNFKGEYDIIPKKDRAFYALLDKDGFNFGYLNAKIGLSRFGGPYSEIIEFSSNAVEGDLDVKNAIKNIKYLICDMCQFTFGEKHELFKYFLLACERKRWLIINE